MKHTPTLRTVYTSPCGRLKVERHAHRDFNVYLDGHWIGAEVYQHEAEMVGADALCVAIREEQVMEADEAAEREDDAVAQDTEWAELGRYSGYSWGR